MTSRLEAEFGQIVASRHVREDVVRRKSLQKKFMSA